MAPELPEAEYEQLENFEFRNQIPRLSKAVALGALIEKLTSPDVNLSPAPVKHADGSVRYPGLDNHGMGSIFEELVRRFNEENNEEAGEHWTPRDAVPKPPVLAKRLAWLPIAAHEPQGMGGQFGAGRVRLRRENQGKAAKPRRFNGVLLGVGQRHAGKARRESAGRRMVARVVRRPQRRPSQDDGTPPAGA